MPTSEITLAQLEDDPYPVLAELRDAAPVAWVEVLGGWVVTGYALADRVMRDAATFTVDDPRFTTAQVIGPSMLSLDGAEHQRHRSPFAPPLRHAAVRSRLAARVDTTARAIVSGFAARGRAELRQELAAPLAVEVVASVLGLAAVEPAQLLGWYRAIVDAVTELSTGRAASAGGGAAFAELRDAVVATLETGGDTLLTDAAEHLGQDEVVSNAAVMLFGGIETNEGMTAALLWHLLAEAEALELVRNRPELLANAVEESLRLEPAAARVDRYATCDVALAGTRIRRGDLVIVSLGAANRDPTVFAEPDRFDVARSNAKRHLSFARGPHACLGMHVARIETTAAADAVLALPGVRLDPERSPGPHGLVFRKPEAVVATWQIA